MSRITDLINSLNREDFLNAIKMLDQGMTTSFSESVKYDVVYLGKRYAPKMVSGLALELKSNIQFRPSSFKGGEESTCFKVLRKCGFSIAPKVHLSQNSITNDFEEILKLQTQYSSTNTDEMKRRGELIRNSVPNHIYEKIEDLEPIFSSKGYSFMVEGSDGVGRKNESAWVRVYDPIMSPSATQGWYVVIHFSRKGDRVFSTIGCGATVFKAGSIQHLPDEQLESQISWVKKIANNTNFDTNYFADKPQLHGNSLSRQFEKAIAFSKAYNKNSIVEGIFWKDLKELCSLLVEVYERARMGKAPQSEAPEIRLAEEDISIAISNKKTTSRGQGRGLSFPERSAVELQAMKVAKEGLINYGFKDIKDVSNSESYDFKASKNNLDWFIEVKGTTSTNFDVFLLTASELNLHLKHKGNTVLALVSDIELIRSDATPLADGGKLELIVPWEPENWEFSATAYRASRK